MLGVTIDYVLLAGAIYVAALAVARLVD